MCRNACVGLFTTKCSTLGGQKRELDPEAVVTGDCAAPSVNLSWVLSKNSQCS